MYVLQKEVRLLRRFSKKVLDDPLGGSGSPESEAGSQTEGTPVRQHYQQHLSSLSREDSDEEREELSSEVRAGYTATAPSLHMCHRPDQPSPTCCSVHWGIVLACNFS